MPYKENPDLSLMFYHYLCRVIGTEDGVRKRRQTFTAQDNVESGKYISYINSGSKAEGLDLDGSDWDLMILHNLIPVYENVNKVTHFQGTYPVIIDTTDCKPGFTQLKSHLKIPFCNYSDYKAGDWYFSSQSFRDIRNVNRSFITHGPCNSATDGRFDFACCLRCSDWVLQAQPWLLRAQNSGLKNEVINQVFEFGVLFVPIGCESSPNINLEWRISFSFAEKLLIWSYNHVQLLCYALLKIFLKEVIQHTTDDLLCSYFVKTIMLWICEETHSSQWKANNIISCFLMCLKRLTYCVKYKTCAHHFISENDLFENRFSIQQHKHLLCTLNQLQNLGWTCLLQTKTIRSFRSYLELPLSCVMPKSSYVQCLQYLSVNFSLQERCVFFCLHAKNKDFYIYKLSQTNLLIAQDLNIKSDVLSGNKQRYCIYRKRLCHSLIGLNQDSVSGWLMLASFFYVRKQYKICKVIITHCLLACSRDKCVIAENVHKEIQTRFEFIEATLGIRPISLTKKYVINLIRFKPSSQILPEEMEVFRDEGDIMIFPPMVFGLFLQFLCDYHLGYRKEQNESLCYLKKVIANKYLIINAKQLEKAHILLSLVCSLHND